MSKSKQRRGKKRELREQWQQDKESKCAEFTRIIKTKDGTLSGKRWRESYRHTVHGAHSTFHWVSPGDCWTDLLSPCFPQVFKVNYHQPNCSSAPCSWKRTQNVSFNTSNGNVKSALAFSIFKFTKDWVHIAHLFDSKTKDLIYVYIFLLVHLESSSESCHSIIIIFFYYYHQSQRWLACCTFQIRTAVCIHFTHSSKLLQSLYLFAASIAPGSWNAFHCHILLESQSGNQHFLVRWVTFDGAISKF